MVRGACGAAKDLPARPHRGRGAGRPDSRADGGLTVTGGLRRTPGQPADRRLSDGRPAAGAMLVDDLPPDALTLDQGAGGRVGSLHMCIAPARGHRDGARTRLRDRARICAKLRTTVDSRCERPVGRTRGASVAKSGDGARPRAVAIVDGKGAGRMSAPEASVAGSGTTGIGANGAAGSGKAITGAQGCHLPAPRPVRRSGGGRPARPDRWGCGGANRDSVPEGLTRRSPPARCLPEPDPLRRFHGSKVPP